MVGIYSVTVVYRTKQDSVFVFPCFLPTRLTVRGTAWYSLASRGLVERGGVGGFLEFWG